MADHDDANAVDPSLDPLSFENKRRIVQGVYAASGRSDTIGQGQISTNAINTLAEHSFGIGEGDNDAPAAAASSISVSLPSMMKRIARQVAPPPEENFFGGWRKSIGSLFKLPTFFGGEINPDGRLSHGNDYRSAMPTLFPVPSLTGEPTPAPDPNANPFTANLAKGLASSAIGGASLKTNAPGMTHSFPTPSPNTSSFTN